ncbi:MAG: hypothetical protein BroJett024_20810 [Alphaproteobacteria bacterium]|jgi:hypothetical protein|nr:MAG: hypothetical protein BroJett024_20810 [Alphaproteobacteria bacterium]
MRKQPKVLLIASALVASLVAAPALLAQDSRDHGMMGPDSMMGNGGMMGTMGSMMRMMEHCSQMMGADSRQPNDQWRKAPSAPSEKR